MVEGSVKSWDDDAGSGVLTSPDVPGELFAHFSSIDAVGYRSLIPASTFFDWEPYPHGQGGYFYRATRVQRPGSASG